MSANAFREDLFGRLPVVGILRGFSEPQVQRIIPAALEGGLSNVEITMNTSGAVELIRLASELATGSANLGAGTVCTLRDLDMALGAGASFIVTPTVVPEVIRACVDLKVPIFPGAFSPTEIERAFSLGATMVKVFPSDVTGPSYIRALRGPFPQWRLMPTGGVTVDTLPAYYQAGAAAFGVGSPLFNPQQVHAENWTWITEQTQRFAAAYAACIAQDRM